MITIKLDNPEDFGYDPNSSLTSTKIDAMVEEIKMAIDTGSGEVMGAQGLDGDLEEYIFKTNPDLNLIRNKILRTINNYSELASEFIININANFAKGTERNVALILVDIKERSMIENSRAIRFILS